MPKTSKNNHSHHHHPSISISPSSPHPAQQGACYGCGVALQTDFPAVNGYVPPDEYEEKRVHRQLYGMMLCARCSDLSQGRMVNAVAGQGGERMSAGKGTQRM